MGKDKPPVSPFFQEFTPFVDWPFPNFIIFNIRLNTLLIHIKSNERYSCFIDKERDKNIYKNTIYINLNMKISREV